MKTAEPRLPWQPFSRCSECERAAAPAQLLCDLCQAAADREAGISRLEARKHAEARERRAS